MLFPCPMNLMGQFGTGAQPSAATQHNGGLLQDGHGPTTELFRKAGPAPFPLRRPIKKRATICENISVWGPLKTHRPEFSRMSGIRSPNRGLANGRALLRADTAQEPSEPGNRSSVPMKTDERTAEHGVFEVQQRLVKLWVSVKPLKLSHQNLTSKSIKHCVPLGQH